jgi:hypothetical protein
MVKGHPREVVKAKAAVAKRSKAARPASDGTAPTAGETVGPYLKVRTMADVVTKAVPWLWPGRVPLGMLTLLDGDPSLGKSTITADIAARLTRGLPMPGAAAPECPAADVLFLAAEDSAEHTIRPRLEAAGADLARCHLLDAADLGDRERPPKLPDDLPAIELLIAEKGIKLVVIDPILGFLNGGVDSNSDQSARDVLHAIKLAAERTGAAVVCLRHLNKRGAGPAMYRGGGSIAFTASARSALVAAKHPDRPDARVLATVKCNLAAIPKAIGYTLEDAGGVPRIAWGDELDLTADDLLAAAAPPARDTAIEDAKDALAGWLDGGPVPSEDLYRRAADAGISRRTLHRAKDALGVRASKAGFAGPWTWTLPIPPPTDPDGEPLPLGV